MVRDDVPAGQANTSFSVRRWRTSGGACRGPALPTRYFLPAGDRHSTPPRTGSVRYGRTSLPPEGPDANTELRGTRTELTRAPLGGYSGMAPPPSHAPSRSVPRAVTAGSPGAGARVHWAGTRRNCAVAAGPAAAAAGAGHGGAVRRAGRARAGGLRAAALPAAGPLGPVALDGRPGAAAGGRGGRGGTAGLLEWLEWGGVPLDLRRAGRGRRHAGAAPTPESGAAREAGVRPVGAGLAAASPAGARGGAAVPALSRRAAEAESGASPVRPRRRLVDRSPTACHRLTLCWAGGPGPAQPWAFSYASRMVAGTRPRSLTS